MNAIFKYLTAAFTLLITLGLNTPVLADQRPITVAIVAPVEIPAMEEIIQGFENELNHLYHGKIVYIVQNAQGDMNIQRTIFQQLTNQKIDLVVPIGTATNQMALSIIKTTPIVTLAAQFTEKDRAQSPNKNMTNIIDEVNVDSQLAFIHKAMPNLTHLTIVYSPDDRIYKQVQQADVDGNKYGITIQTLMVSQLPELYTVSKHIDPKSQAIFILKDEMVVSGISTLAKQANAKGIALIASDDGSVQNGAAFAVGVSESQIGAEGAVLANTVLKGTPAKNVPIKLMTDYRVFTNAKAAKSQHVDLSYVNSAARFYNYLLIK